MTTPHVIVIGAGIGGLTAAASLARQGLDVTVLEAQVYPGGCAGTFYHRGYYFDLGATLAAGFYPGGPMDMAAQATGIHTWPIKLAEAAMTVYLPNGQRITLWSDERRWQERLSAFGQQGLSFWEWQERTADTMWDLALRLPAWPPQSPRDAAQLAQVAYNHLREAHLTPRLASLFIDAFKPVGAHLKDTTDDLRLFVDAQLLISAQATSERVNALYGASAMDLSRRGVAHLEGGMGAIAQSLVSAIRQSGGQVHFRQEATRLVSEAGKPIILKTRQGKVYKADIVIANLTPANLAQLMDGSNPMPSTSASVIPDDVWGAFVMYLGIDESVVAPDEPYHRQVIAGRPLGEGNSIFISVNPAWDTARAPRGQRAITISSHTRLREWWNIYASDKAKYEARKAAYAEKILKIAETAIPGIRQATRLMLTGTPVTFQHFTHRAGGWVGGYPQTHLFRTKGARILSRLWMVGDSIFPGQSIAAAALGGIRVAQQVLNALKYHYISFDACTSGILARRSIGDP